MKIISTQSILLITVAIVTCKTPTWTMGFVGQFYYHPYSHRNPRKRNHPNSSRIRYSLEEGNESEEQLAKRMELIRQIQKAFYLDEEAVTAPGKGCTIMKQVPLWRVQWTELPGFQNVLNVHVPHYTNMFQKILSSNTTLKPMYFGHIYLPGGSDNLDNPEYAMYEGNANVAMIGTLMQISDYQQLHDGTLVLIVQGLERFRISNVIRHHSPYAIADIEILPDKELAEAHGEDGEKEANGNSNGWIDAVEESFRMHPYENRAVGLADCEAIQNTISLSPLSNYDGTFRPTNPLVSIVVKSSSDQALKVLELEQKLWIQLDEMIQLLQQLVESAESPVKGTMPVPTQILGLIPRDPPSPWPSSFSLQHYATKLEIEKLLVGTYSKSPFVRVDDLKGYSPLRRAQRFSYAVWTLMDTVIALDDSDITKQEVLEMESTKERLEAAIHKMNLISNVIRGVLKG